MNVIVFLIMLGAALRCMYEGWMYLSNPDKAWEKHEAEMLNQGIEPKRTPEWESKNEPRGFVMIALGLFFMVIGLLVLSQ